MAEQELLDILSLTVSPDPTDQQRVLSYINQQSQHNFPEFVNQLATILANPRNVAFVRQAAGLQLKNTLVSNDEEHKILLQQRWFALPEEIKNHVKESIVQTLGTELRPSSAAQCISAIASVEISRGQWLNVIDILKANVTTTGISESLKESSFETLGYICQSLPPFFMEEFAKNVSTAIVSGMREAENSMYVKLAAKTAFLSFVEATYTNSENEKERNLIMEHVCRAINLSQTERRFSVQEFNIPLVGRRKVNLKWASSQFGYWAAILFTFAFVMENAVWRWILSGVAALLLVIAFISCVILYRRINL